VTLGDPLAQTRARGGTGAIARAAVFAPLPWWRLAWRWFEMLAIFFVGPTLWIMGVRLIGIIPTLLVVGAYGVLVLLTDRTFDRRMLWNTWAALREAPRIVVVWLVGAALITLGVLAFAPDRFLEFPRRNPGLWVAVMCLYPIFSVYPQELFCRAMFFHRYAPLLGARPITATGDAMPRGVWRVIVVNAAAFGWLHVVFGHWLSVALTFAGGLLFAVTYVRARSLAAAWLEHALYGCLVFTLGLGQFFYAGRNGRPPPERQERESTLVVPSEARADGTDPFE
jgi:membrane protease YdiL (CAAX protease family)